jgi:hypothetical protein
MMWLVSIGIVPSAVCGSDGAAKALFVKLEQVVLIGSTALAVIALANEAHASE